MLKADGDILLQAAKNLYEEKTRSKSSGGSIGIGISTGQQNGISIEAGMNMSRSKEDGKDKSWTNSNIVAGNILVIESGGNTTFSGAAGRADQIIASVGGNLLLESLQDSSRFKSSQTNAGFSISLCIPPICYGSSSGSLSVGAGYMKSNFDSVTQQAGLWAGDGGFQIDVKGNTSLVGAVIGSSEQAVADRLNQLATGTLITKDIKNEAEYKAAQVSLGLSPSLGKTTLSPPGVAAAFDNSKSTTESAISGGTIIIRDAVAQQDLTGMTVSETIANLNRDTSDTLNALKPIFDKEKIEAGFEIALELQKQGGTFLANRAREAEAEQARIGSELANELKKGENANFDKIAQLTQRYEALGRWAPGGDYRLIATAIIGGVSGNVSASLVDMARASAAGYLQGLAAQQVKELTASLGDDAAGTAARAALHAVVGCAGGAMTGSCSASAIGAASATVVAALLEKLDKATTADEREQRINLVTSLLAGVVTATGGLGVELPGLVGSARLELENNSVGWVINAGVRGLAVCVKSAWCRNHLARVGLKNLAEAATSGAMAALVAKKMLDGMSRDSAEVAALIELAAQQSVQPEQDLSLPPYPADVDLDVQIPPSVAVDPDKDDVLMPGQPSAPQPAPGPLVNPGDNRDLSGEGVLINPLPDLQDVDLIFNSPGSGSKGVPSAILDQEGKLPPGIGGVGTPIPMPSSALPDRTAEDFAKAAFNGQTPDRIITDFKGPGSWLAYMPDGTVIVYRRGGQASADTAPDTATVEINSAAVKAINANKPAKFKFPGI